MRLDWNELPQLAVLGAVVTELVGDGWKVEVECDGDGFVVVSATFEGDAMKTLTGWVKLQLQNGGAGVISNYTQSLNSTINPIVEMAEKLFGG